MSDTVAETLLRRIGTMWDRFEATGEDRWMIAALEADRLYRRLKTREV